MSMTPPRISKAKHGVQSSPPQSAPSSGGSCGPTFAPTQAVTLDDGSSVELRELYAERPLALVFLRHLACLFCREIVARLEAIPSESLAFVSGERAEACAEFRERYGVRQRVISDPGRVLYQAFGLERGGLGAFVSPRIFQKGIAALRAGHRQGMPSSDPRQLGGVFVVGTDGRVLWEHRAGDQADNPEIADVYRALQRAALAPAAEMG